jgi:hypothetical protein
VAELSWQSVREKFLEGAEKYPEMSAQWDSCEDRWTFCESSPGEYHQPADPQAETFFKDCCRLVVSLLGKSTLTAPFHSWLDLMRTNKRGFSRPIMLPFREFRQVMESQVPVDTSRFPRSASGGIYRVFKESAEFCADLELSPVETPKPPAKKITKDCEPPMEARGTGNLSLGPEPSVTSSIPDLPTQFTTEARARMVVVRNQAALKYKQSPNKFDALFPFALNIALAFAEECCPLVKSNSIAVEEMERLVTEFRDRVFFHASIDSGNNRRTHPGMWQHITSEAKARLENSQQWAGVQRMVVEAAESVAGAPKSPDATQIHSPEASALNGNEGTVERIQAQAEPEATTGEDEHAGRRSKRRERAEDFLGRVNEHVRNHPASGLERNKVHKTDISRVAGYRDHTAYKEWEKLDSKTKDGSAPDNNIGTALRMPTEDFIKAVILNRSKKIS